jgi:hypothetical protein
VWSLRRFGRGGDIYTQGCEVGKRDVIFKAKSTELPRKYIHWVL